MHLAKQQDAKSTTQRSVRYLPNKSVQYKQEMDEGGEILSSSTEKCVSGDGVCID